MSGLPFALLWSEMYLPASKRTKGNWRICCRQRKNLNVYYWGQQQLLRHAVRHRIWGNFSQNSSKCKDLLESSLSSNVTEIKWNELKCLQPESYHAEREQYPMMSEVPRRLGNLACPAAAEGVLCGLNSHEPHILYYEGFWSQPSNPITQVETFVYIDKSKILELKLFGNLIWSSMSFLISVIACFPSNMSVNWKITAFHFN